MQPKDPHIRSTPPPKKECNYGLRASKNSSRLTKFLVNSIHIYGSESIYYENTFCNESNNIYLIS
jgi:hypothetical protein